VGEVVGIDLGTTYSAIAHVNKYGRAELIPLHEGGELLPSVVLFEDPPMVGPHARNTAVARPLETVQFVKRHMGEPDWRHRDASGKEHGPEDVSALILKRLKDDAEAYLGTEVTKAVISVPAYFDDARRKATQDAGRIAGLEVLRIVNEPTAAALAFGVDTSTNGNVLVYDLGGGTFDVTIMRIENDDLTVLASNGDPQLGGFDWDNRIMEWLDARFVERGGRSHLGDPVTEQDLRIKAELIKHSLSGREKAAASLTVEGTSHTIEMRREDLEAATEDLLERTGRTLGYVVDESGLSLAAINRVLLVGGSTRMPAVRQLVERLTGKKPAADVHPDKSVALGAAILANLEREIDSPVPVRDARGDLVATKVQDITSHSLGVAAVMDPNRPDHLLNSIILPKGSQVPCRAQETYYTMSAYQDAWDAQVTQGEDQDLAFVTIVGEQHISIPPRAEQSPFEVTFEYDRDATIHMYVRDLATGQAIGELHITRQANLTDDAVERKAEAMKDVNPS
jgi:molecular chaperone DnaK